jgi:signal recognition particle subunit SRP72
LVADIDAAALESAGVPTTTTLVSEARKRSIAPTKAVAPRSKRLRKVRMPKDFDPNKKIDAERWLPMRDRTYYRPKGRKGKKRAEGLTQGGPVAEEKKEVKKEAPKKQQKKGKGKK